MLYKDALEIILTAFLKGDGQLRKQIAAEVTPSQFFGWDWVYEIMLQLLESVGKLEISDLYKETEKMVEGYLLEHMMVVDDAFAAELPNKKSLAEAIELLLSDKQRTTDEQERAEKAILAAMLKGNEESRKQILDSDCSENFEHFDRANLIQWIKELYLSKGVILKEDLIRKLEAYMTTRILPSYTMRIDDLRATKMPDEDSLVAAISTIRQQ